MTPKKERFRILSLDGGGLRGIMPIQILKEVERLTGKSILECFDLFAGTSTGGLIVAALTGAKKEMTLDDLEDLYLDKGKIIFPPHKNRLHAFSRDIKNFFRPRFKPNGRDKILDDIFGENRLVDCRKPILITAYNIKEGKSELFRTRRVDFRSMNKYRPEENFYLRDICKATSAAPTYLPSHYFDKENGKENNHDNQTTSKNNGHHQGSFLTSMFTPIRSDINHYIDGGVFMNNPTMGAIAEILRHKEEIIYGPKFGLKKEEIYVLSIGTGNFDHKVTPRQSQKWGQINWAAPLINIMMNGTSQTVDYQVREILPVENYLRVNFRLEDKRFDDMTDSRPKSLMYWKNEALKRAREITKEPVDSKDNNHLSNFLKNSGLI